MFMNRVIDNIFSNISKYALEEAGVVIRFESDGKELGVSFENKIKRNGINAESNHIGIKTCERIMEKMGGRFDTINDGDSFCARFTLPVCE